MLAKVGAVIALTIVALAIGLLGIVVLIGVGEALNNGIAAFAAVSLPFALLAGLLSWLVPRAQWAIVVAMSAPITLLCMAGASMGAIYLPGAMWTILITGTGAYIGGRLKRSRPSAPRVPPP